MATSTSTLTNTSIATPIAMSPESSLHRRKPSDIQTNGTTSTDSDKTTSPRLQRTKDTKYRHVFATHSLQRNSCLSHDAESHPSFLGFRNLMILVLSTLSAYQLTACPANCPQSFLTSA